MVGCKVVGLKDGDTEGGKDGTTVGKLLGTDTIICDTRNNQTITKMSDHASCSTFTM